MVLFSESFFADTDPLDNQVVYSIVEKCKELSAQNRVLVQFCLLHKFNTNDQPYWLQRKYNPVNSRRKIKKRVVNLKSEANASSFLIANKWHRDRIANYTLSIYEGRIVTIYRKSTYCNAANFWIPLREGKAIYAYEFGDFKAYSVEESSISEIFTGGKSLIAIRMCSDMNDPHLDTSFTKLTIVHANDHPALSCKNLVLPSLYIDDAHGFEFIRPDNTITGTKMTIDDIFIEDSCICQHFDLRSLRDSTDSALIVECFIEEIDKK